MGLNSAPVPTKFWLQDTIADMEETARKLPKENLRMRVCGIINSSKLPEDNITKEQMRDEVILPADKEKVMERGTTTGSCLMTPLPTTQESKISIEHYTMVRKSQQSCTRLRPSSLYGLPKVQKESVPLRPIV